MSTTTPNTSATATTASTTRRAKAVSIALSVVALAGLSACGTDAGAAEPISSSAAFSQAAAELPSDTTVAGGASTGEAAGVSIEDPWVKSADEGMSAAFGILTVDTTEATVVSATTTASSMIELHETIPDDTGEMTMQEKSGGFTVRDDEDLILEPGGNHLMLIGITEPLKAGETVTVDLTMSDGSVFTFEAPVKDFSGANETYVGGGDPGGMSSTDMGSHDGDETMDHDTTTDHGDDQ